MTEEKRRLLGPIEKLVLVLAVLLIAYVVYKNDDINFVERSESVQIIDKPHAGKAAKTRVYRPEESDARVEAALEQLARQFSGESTTATSNWEQMGLSEDEGYYYEQVKKRNDWDTSIKRAGDWLTLLRASHKTYSQLQSVFSDVIGKPKEEIAADDVNFLMKNERSAEHVYSRIEQIFNIPKSDIQSFADKGRRAVSDWADFIENNQSKK